MFQCRKLAGVGIEHLITLRRASIENQCLLAHFLTKRNFGEKNNISLKGRNFPPPGMDMLLCFTARSELHYVPTSPR
ncbi:hypothetical protein SAMN05216332_111119 [Nitrosospira briensis]|nr:hypothetical protein SAMN05216332_111119 [Nitrosospira briensis]